MKNFLLYILAFFIITPSFFGQTNLISNPQLEDSTCDDVVGNSCSYMGQCVDHWNVSHGTPNYIMEDCTRPIGTNRFIQMIYKTNTVFDQSEGVFTSVSISPGPYTLFIRARTDITTGMRIQASLDNGLESVLGNSCQEPPQINNPQNILDQQLGSEFTNSWNWVQISFIAHDNYSQLQIYPKVIPMEREGKLHIDCISLYQGLPGCQDLIQITAPSNTTTTPAGTYRASQIKMGPSPGLVNVPAGSNVRLIGGQAVTMSPNFRAKQNFHAFIAPCFSDSFEPPCTCVQIGGKLRSNTNRSSQSTIHALKITPNPFDDYFQLDYHVQTEENVYINLIDLQGRILRNIVDEEQALGPYQLRINTQDLPTGIYFLQININGEQITKKMVKANR